MQLVRPEGFEPPTPWFVAKYSIQMSYGRLKGANYSKNPCAVTLNIRGLSHWPRRRALVSMQASNWNGVSA
jgi:hypothetical protein